MKAGVAASVAEDGRGGLLRPKAQGIFDTFAVKQQTLRTAARDRLGMGHELTWKDLCGLWVF